MNEVDEVTEVRGWKSWFVIQNEDGTESPLSENKESVKDITTKFKVLVFAVIPFLGLCMYLGRNEPKNVFRENPPAVAGIEERSCGELQSGFNTARHGHRAFVENGMKSMAEQSMDDMKAFDAEMRRRCYS